MEQRTPEEQNKNLCCQPITPNVQKVSIFRLHPHENVFALKCITVLCLHHQHYTSISSLLNAFGNATVLVWKYLVILKQRRRWPCSHSTRDLSVMTSPSLIRHQGQLHLTIRNRWYGLQYFLQIKEPALHFLFTACTCDCSCDTLFENGEYLCSKTCFKMKTVL